MGGMSNLHIRNRGSIFQSRSPKDAGISESLAWRLISCKDSEAKGWFNSALDDETEQVCWKGDCRSKYQAPFGLYKRGPLSASDEEMTYEQNYRRNFHLLSTDTMEFCLSASPNRKLTSKESSRGSFSPCRWDTNQLMPVQEEFDLGSLQGGEEKSLLLCSI